MADRPSALVVLTCLVLAACDGPTGASPEESAARSSTATRANAALAQDFNLVDATLTSSDGTVLELPVWFAGTPDQRHRGLTGVTDLGEDDGMLFQFESPATYSFYMWRTEIALDVLFFDERGRHVGDARMEPCPHEAPDRCPRYLPDVPFLTALEVPAGALDEHRVDSDWSIGIEPPATDRPVPDRA